MQVSACIGQLAGKESTSHGQVSCHSATSGGNPAYGSYKNGFVKD
jgi:hypothetical protein